MTFIFVLLAALAPVGVALCYIYKKDEARPEPTKWLLKAFGYGVLSVFVSFLFSRPASAFLGLEVSDSVYPSFTAAFADAFLLAAIPEELAKLIMLWLLLRKNPFFDEKFDGIVYAVCIGMGFAGLENVMYLVDGMEDGTWVTTGISRALFSIPGHFFFAVLMGYYYSLYYWNIDRSLLTKVLILGAPVIAHGLYDAILMSSSVSDGLSVLCVLIFLLFLNKLRKIGKERIERLQNQ